MKRLTIIGILFIIFAIGIFYVSVSQIQSSLSTAGVPYAINVPANYVLYNQFNLTNQTAIGLYYYTSGTPIDYYLMNQTGFNYVQASLAAHEYIINQSRYGSGYITKMYNSIGGVYPAVNYSNESAYSNTAAPILPAGSYYNVFENQQNANVIVTYTMFFKSQEQLNGFIFTNAAYGISGAAIFFIGILLILYSLFIAKKADTNIKKINEESYDSLYSRQNLSGSAVDKSKPERRRKGKWTIVRHRKKQ